MNKVVKSILEKYNFVIEKNYGYGAINGYEVNVVDRPLSKGPVFYFSSFITPAQKRKYVIAMRDYKFPSVQVDYSNFGIEVTIGSFGEKEFKAKCEYIIKKVLGILNSYNAPKNNICPLSGQEMHESDSRLAYIGKGPVKVRTSVDAIVGYNDELEKDKEEHKNESISFMPGFFAVVLINIFVVFLHMFLSLFGHIAAISTGIVVVLGAIFYLKSGAKANFLMVITCTVIGSLFALGILLCRYQNIALALRYYNSDYSLGIDAFRYCYENINDFRKSLIIDVLLNGIYALIGCFISIIILIKANKRPKKIK